MTKETSPFDECRLVLEELLLNSPNIPLCTKNNISYIDNLVRDYLLQKGHDEWLAHDVSYGAQVGGISEAALCSFVREKRVFDGKKGRYKIQESYGPMSVRSFQAVPF